MTHDILFPILAVGMSLIGTGLFLVVKKPSAGSPVLKRIRGERTKPEVPPARYKGLLSLPILLAPVAGGGAAWLAGAGLSGALLGLAAGACAWGAWNVMSGLVRRDRIEDQLPAALDIMAQSVSAGNTIDQSVSDMISGSRDPLSSVFADVASEATNTGKLDVAMENAAIREKLSILKMLAVAVRVQKKSGGSFGPVLKTVTENARSAVRLKKMIKVKTGSVKATAVGMCLLPVVIASGLLYFNDGYRQAALHTHDGRMILVAAAAMMTVGMGIVWAMLRVKRQ